MINFSEYRKWQRKHPNFMTPHIIGLYKYGELIIELSEGTGFSSDTIYGVTEVSAKGGKFKSLGGEVFTKLADAKVYLYDKYKIYLAPYKNVP